MAGRTGIEPATSGVTGRRSNQLNYHPLKGSTVKKINIQILLLATAKNEW